MNKTQMTKMFQIRADKKKFINPFNPINLFNLGLLLLFSFSAFASDDFPPRANQLVIDYTGTLSQAEQNQLEAKLEEFNRATSTQIAVVIMKSIGEYEINDYAVQLANKWQIGQKGKNNGILILLAMETHKVSIQIGYGLEGVSPDILAKRIIENEMIPSFKQGNFYAGLDKGTDALMSLVKGEFKADEYVNRGERFPWAIILIILFIIIISIGAKANRTRNYAHTNHISFWTAWFLLSQISRKQRGSWGNFSSGSGRFGGFGGGGGGGFGGFGGGGFGGGGASGSW
jgi:uncharacterized protein